LVKYAYWRKGCGFGGGTIGIAFTNSGTSAASNFLNDIDYYASTWQGRSGYVTSTFANAYVYANQQGTVGWTGFIDDVVVQQVTDPPVSTSGGLHITSANNGTTRNWKTVGSGFLYNSIARFEIIRE
jgi:hypothetical protein